MARPTKVQTLEQQVRRLEWRIKQQEKVMRNIFMIALHAECCFENGDICLHEAEAFFAAIRTMAEDESCGG